MHYFVKYTSLLLRCQTIFLLLEPVLILSTVVCICVCVYVYMYICGFAFVCLCLVDKTNTVWNLFTSFPRPIGHKNAIQRRIQRRRSS